MKNAIFIIGNGFDLQCGLKSSYNDFFEYKKNNNEIFKIYFDLQTNFWDEIIKEPSSDFLEIFTIWDMLFLLKSKKHYYNRWCNIEEEILNTFLICENNLCFWEKVFRNYIVITSKPEFIDDNAPIELKLAYLLAFSFKVEIRNIEQLVKILFTHLKHFEYSFSEYLKKQINQDYIDKASKLFLKLFSLDGDTFRSGLDNRSIISFNYTNHVDDLVSNRYCSMFTNVHGDLNSEPVNIIFGIDDYELQSNQKYLSESIFFSKSFRIMTNFPRFNVFGESLLHENVNHIVIYGHSLNEADYSYFQSIFDHYDLYKSNIKLWFAFTKHVNYSEEEFIYLIRKLIIEYGKTLDNKDHGKNLFHKLLLENRIKKIEII